MESLTRIHAHAYTHVRFFLLFIFFYFFYFSFFVSFFLFLFFLFKIQNAYILGSKCIHFGANFLHFGGKMHTFWYQTSYILKFKTCYSKTQLKEKTFPKDTSCQYLQISNKKSETLGRNRFLNKLNNIKHL